MSTARSAVQKPGSTLPKEARITVLTLLKNFYDEQIFELLIKEFFDSDLQISLVAINASASLGNEAAVPHLYRILESGRPQQKLAAIQSLAAINAPSSIEQLAKYFTLLQDTSIRREILRAINRISPLAPKALELNRAALMDPAMAREFYEVILVGLMEADDLELVKSHLLRAAPEVQRTIFQRILQAPSEKAGKFLDYFRDKTAQLDPNTLGCYLCAYELKVARPAANFVIDLLSGADPRTTTSFLISLSNYSGEILNHGRTFRLLLRLPYVDLDSEALIGGFITKIVAEIRVHAPLVLNEILLTTSANLEAVFTKVKKQHISLKGIKERDALLVVLLSKILEQHADAKLLAEAQGVFKSEVGAGAETLIQKIRDRLVTAPEDEQNRFQACLPLFSSQERLVRLNASQTLARVNLTTPTLQRRLNRLIRVAGILDIRGADKKIQEVLAYAREERVHFLEETSVVTLCQLMSKATIEQARAVFASPNKYPHSLNGYIRGARFLPARIFINPLLKLLITPGVPPKTLTLVVDSMKNMKLEETRETKGITSSLIRVMNLPGLDNTLLTSLSDIVARYGDSGIFQPLLDLTAVADPLKAQLAVRILRNLARRERNLPLDVLTHRLYQLLERKEQSPRIEALLTLIALQDDYAVHILDDFVQAKDEGAIVEILANIEKPVSREMLAFMLKLLPLDSATVHRELRRVLPEFCQGEEAEEIRRALLDALKGVETAGVGISPPAAIQEVSEGGLIEQAKLEFKLLRESERQLTVMFADVVGYTKRTSELQGTDMRRTNLMKLIQSFERSTLPTIEALKGEVIKKMGDGLLAVFKSPLNAAIASLLIQKKIREDNQYRVEDEKINVRVGLNTGPVLRKDGDIYGDTVNVASRMETKADPGHILLTQATYDRIKDHIRCMRLGDLEFKGKGAITTYSADEILVDISPFLSAGRQAGPKQPAAGSGQDAKTITDLKESMFEPDFRVPTGAAVEERVARRLQGVFKDLSGAVAKVTKDYHEEYLFKQYLQNKWNELFPG
jgi:class 3 adenylate cyclase/HEAT repeat protein